MTWGRDRWRLYGLALREVGCAMGMGLARLGAAARRRPTPRRLLIAPQDLRTSDPTVSNDVYAGYFVFAGRAVSTGGRSPYAFAAPSRAWGEALCGFGWLRHLKAADTALARANARALVDEFLTARKVDRRLARRTPVAARRLISFLSQSPLLLDGADHGFYQRLLRGIGDGVRDLERDLRLGARPLARLQAAIALCQASLCCEGLERRVRRATADLGRELDRQILPDGGHVSRNPQLLVELLLDLLPLRQAYASRGMEPPDALVRAIDRMLPMLRLFRHGDGALAHFNGMGVTDVDHLATIRAYENAGGRAMRHAPHSGYERLEAGRTVVIADVGATPPIGHSGDAHAGCLSFELSSGAERIVVNCGAAQGAREEIQKIARSTAAHSTVEVAQTSSARFLAQEGGWAERLIAGRLLHRLDPVVIRGPRVVRAERQERPDGIALAAGHDGYKALFGRTHERRWRLAPDGGHLDGEDAFVRDSTDRPLEPAAIRFHLMPGVEASRSEDGHTIMLALPNRETWRFETDAPEAALEDSVFFAAPGGIRRTEQIVLRVRAGEAPRVRWSFERVTEAG